MEIQKSTKFSEFWEEIILFNEYQTAVQERRHCNVTYLPFRISIWELIEQVQKRKPGILTPSEECVRLQFCPKNPRHKSSFKPTGRSNIKYMVLERQMRSEHHDSKYTFLYYIYLKEFVVNFIENAILTFHNDKATIPVGEPLHAISTNVKMHNWSFGVENVVIKALDHDWNVCGLVPSIVLVCDIPDFIKSSFITGTPYSITKEKVLEKSDSFRLATELVNTFCPNYSTDGISLAM